MPKHKTQVVVTNTYHLEKIGQTVQSIRPFFFHGRQVIVSRDVALLFKSPSQLYSVESSIYQNVNDKSLTSSNINVQNMRRHPYEVKIYGCDVNIIPAQSNGVLLNFTSSK